MRGLVVGHVFEDVLALPNGVDSSSGAWRTSCMELR